MDDGTWTDKLITLVENHPLIYDKRMKEYTNKDSREKAWLDICQDIIPEWEEMPKVLKKAKCKEVQQKWLNLRSSFNRELREQKKSALGQGYPKRRRYIYFDQLLFLLPVVGAGEKEPNSKIELSENSSEHEDCTDDAISYGEDQTPRPLPSSAASRPEQNTPGISYEQYLHDAWKEKHDSSNDIDEDKTFLLSLVPALKRLSFDKKFEAKMEMLRVLQELSTPTADSVYKNLPPSRTAPSGVVQDGGNLNRKRAHSAQAQTTGLKFNPTSNSSKPDNSELENGASPPSHFLSG